MDILLFNGNHKSINEYKKKVSNYADCICNDFDKKLLSYQSFETIDISYKSTSFKESPVSSFINNISNKNYKNQLIREKCFQYK